IEQGYLEAVIGLPGNLFYGTGIPACILVLNKAGASQRNSVLFINADREYREGKAQNHLRPEDLDKIIYAYRQGQEIPAYARPVPIGELRSEDYNCNIRRYVDNAPPPEPHDVRAHLHGGVPRAEIASLSRYWHKYSGLQDALFHPRHSREGGNPDTNYLDFAPTLTDKRDLAALINAHPGVLAAHQQVMDTLQSWWQQALPVVEALAPEAANPQARPNNVYVMRSQLLKSIEAALAGNGLLTAFQVRGAFATYIDSLKADFKSIAASGWGPELIPDDELLQSQFPEVLAAQEQAQARLAELQALFAAADDEDFEDSDDTGVMTSEQVKDLKARLKDAKGQAKLCKRDPNLGDAATWQRQAEQLEVQLARHKALEEEAKTLKKTIKTIEQRRDQLAASAREKISVEEARGIIIERLQQQLLNIYRSYLRAEQRTCIQAVENLWSKYAVTARQIEAERDQAARQLQAFLVELGYE
ncbi:N-6 DNA methylase, partial [Nitrosomonas sp. ANs5]|uniref:N-6 DNA methylase n=1 Tax=Nitrosomonas sp. ANs5 TaxID=3423941 RepID=UPI003D3287A6